MYNWKELVEESAEKSNKLELLYFNLYPKYEIFTEDVENAVNTNNNLFFDYMKLKFNVEPADLINQIYA